MLVLRVVMLRRGFTEVARRSRNLRRYWSVLKRAAPLAVVVGLFASMLGAAPAHALGPISLRSHPQTPAFVPNWAYTTQDENAPDPDVVRFGNTYYAYTTGTTWGNHIGVLRSSTPDRGFATSSGGQFGSSALPSPPAWQVLNTQSAPGRF